MATSVSVRNEGCKFRAEFACSVHEYCFSNGKLGYFLNFLLDNDKQVFFAVNFFTRATEDDMKKLSQQ
uniref:Uncharacterized protein n=1 Tax=Strigamia maritima TaxID=126957 RepID=T1J3J5_STRMM